MNTNESIWTAPDPRHSERVRENPVISEGVATHSIIRFFMGDWTLTNDRGNEADMTRRCAELSRRGYFVRVIPV